MEKIGLALGGGVARGLAHIGVLKALQQLHIRPDLVSGTSIGAVIGALYAGGMTAEEMERTARGLNWGRRALLIDVTVPRTGLIKGERVKRLLQRMVGDAQFADLNLPFACVATDLMTGEEVVMDDGPVVEAVRASISIPAIFTPVERNGRILVDGGLSAPVPVRALKEMGADFIIAVNVIPSARKRARTSRRGKRPRMPNIFDVIMQTNYIVSYQRVRSNLRRADLVIEPPVEDVDIADFHRIKDCISRGEEAARLALEGTDLGRAGRPPSE